MEEIVTREEKGPVSVLTRQYRPYNLLGPTLLPAIADAIGAAQQAGSRAIVLRGDQRDAASQCGKQHPFVVGLTASQ